MAISFADHCLSLGLPLINSNHPHASLVLKWKLQLKETILYYNWKHQLKETILYYKTGISLETSVGVTRCFRGETQAEWMTEKVRVDDSSLSRWEHKCSQIFSFFFKHCSWIMCLKSSPLMPYIWNCWIKFLDSWLLLKDDRLCIADFWCLV